MNAGCGVSSIHPTCQSEERQDSMFNFCYCARPNGRSAASIAALTLALMVSVSQPLRAQMPAKHRGVPLPLAIESAASLAAVRAVLKPNDRIEIGEYRTCSFEVIDPECPPESAYSTRPSDPPPTPLRHKSEVLRAVVAAFGGKSDRGASLTFSRPLLRNDTIVVFVSLVEPATDMPDMPGMWEGYGYTVLLTHAAQPRLIKKTLDLHETLGKGAW